MAKHTNICVIESRWWEARNTSVRGMFDLLSDIHTNSHHGYEYEMANSRAGFREAIERHLKNPETNYLSIASHGEKQGISLFNEDGVSRTVIRNTLKKTNNDRNIVGLHLGCCSFLSRELVNFLYQEDISPWWIAGYSRQVSWIESTALDFIFFNKILEIKHPFKNPQNTIKIVAKSLKSDCSGLINKLNFQIYFVDEDDVIEPLL